MDNNGIIIDPKYEAKQEIKVTNLYQQDEYGAIVRYDPDYPLPTKIFTTVEVNANGNISDPNFTSLQQIKKNKMYQ